jgi:hypothetical protein
MTLGELVDEYLEMHQAEPVTIAKLCWLLGEATAVLGDVRLAELSPKTMCVSRGGSRALHGLSTKTRGRQTGWLAAPPFPATSVATVPRERSDRVS